jgi:cell volume regulation protein A
MNMAHELILLGGALGLASIFAGLASARLNAPLLLVFLALGMLAGEDGPGGIVFSDFSTSYLVASVALAFILFEGGLKTDRHALRLAAWPALALATVGVVLTTAVVACAAVWLFDADWGQALLIGAVLAPTDAAAVAPAWRCRNG